MSFKDLLGQKFGRLTVLSVDNSEHKEKRQYWFCKCNCGNNKIISVIGRNLINGYTKSCGCLQKEKVSEANKKYNTYDLLGEYGIGYTSKNEEFYFDLEDYDKIKDYYWVKQGKYIQCQQYININETKVIMMHRLVLDLEDHREVDHIYHVEHDNRKNKLRIASTSQNSMNTSIRKDNKSGVPGVFWDKNNKSWVVYIGLNRKQIYLGRFNNFDNAVKARKEAEEKYFKEFSYDNSMKLN